MNVNHKFWNIEVTTIRRYISYIWLLWTAPYSSQEVTLLTRQCLFVKWQYKLQLFGLSCFAFGIFVNVFFLRISRLFRLLLRRRFRSHGSVRNCRRVDVDAIWYSGGVVMVVGCIDVDGITGSRCRWLNGELRRRNDSRGFPRQKSSGDTVKEFVLWLEKKTRKSPQWWSGHPTTSYIFFLAFRSSVWAFGALEKALPLFTESLTAS